MDLYDTVTTGEQALNLKLSIWLLERWLFFAGQW